MKGLKNNTLRSVYDWFWQGIAELYDPNEAKAIAGVIFEDRLGIGKVDLQIQREKRLSESEIVGLYKLIKKFKAHIPVQHITGKAWFRELVLKVNGSVLIPRPETEELVQWVLEDHSQLGPSQPRVWDIGTGSGAIALSVAKEIPEAEVWATDISREALAIAKENALRNGVKVHFVCSDVLNDDPPVSDIDILISNPPYVRRSEMKLMRQNVLDYEPHTALFVPDDDPLIFYREVAKIGLKSLNPDGRIYVEINEALGRETADLFLDSGFSKAIIKKDIFGKERFVRAIL